MWILNIMGKDAQTRGKVDPLLCIPAIKVSLMNFIYKVVILTESSAPPVSTKDKNRYNKRIRNQTANWEGGDKRIIMLYVT